jgi:hypothetical protein
MGHHTEFGRTAFGRQRKTSDAQLARNIVLSMQQTPGRQLSDYGVTEASTVGKMVRELLKGE